MNIPWSSCIRNRITVLAGAILLGAGNVALAGPPPAISVQVATPGGYVSFGTGPQWMPYYAYPVAPVVPVYAPGYYRYGPPPGYWRERRVEYRRPGWGDGWRGDRHEDRHDHRHDHEDQHEHGGRHGGRH